jgi:hypothetical protein
MLRIRKGHVEVTDGRGLHSHHVHQELFSNLLGVVGSISFFLAWTSSQATSSVPHVALTAARNQRRRAQAGLI